MINGTAGFIFVAIVLLLIVLIILLRPLLRSPRSTTTDPHQANLVILRDLLQELERDRDEGMLSESAFTQAQQELQRRWLEETKTDKNPIAVFSSRSRKYTAIALLVFLPLTAVNGYLWLGNPQALHPHDSTQDIVPPEIDAMLQRLVHRLKDDPDDFPGWIMLAHSYKTLGRFAESAEAYRHAEPLVNSDPALLANYAEVLASTRGGSFDGKPEELITRALVLDPDEPQALFLAGSAAMERKNFAAVADYWGRLLQQLEPDSEEAQVLRAAVEKAREITANQRPKTK